jgi:hypothetical protein
VFSLALITLLLGAIAFLAEAGLGNVLPSAFQSPLVDWLLLPVVLLVAFGLLTLYYYRQTLRGEVAEPFPLSLSSPWEGIARFVGVLFLLYLSFLMTAFALILPQLLQIPVLAGIMADVEPVAVLLGPLALFGYLVIWYMRHPTSPEA